jgi:hypothetical protein
MDKAERRRKMAKQREFEAAQGRPRRVYEWEFEQARAKVVDYHSRGMSFKAMAAQTGRHLDTFAKVARDRKPGEKITVSRKVYESIMGLYYEAPAPAPTHDGGLGAKVDPTPSIRRVGAMIADGFPQTWLAKHMGMSFRALSVTMTGQRSYVHSFSEAKIKETYEKLDGVDPLDMGLTPLQKRNAQRHAARCRYPGRMCWDEDTIDDLKAFPEWTGECGTVRGYYLHLKYGIHVKLADKPSGKRNRVLCQPCIDARTENEGVSKTTDEEAVKEALRAGRTYREIAAEEGVSVRTIQRVSHDLKKTGWVPNKQGPGRLKRILEGS